MAAKPAEMLGAADRPPGRPAKTLIVGLGNDILTDDAVGFLIAERLECCLAGRPALTVARSPEVGLGLLDLVSGYDELVLIDAVQTLKAPAGFVHQLDDGTLKHLPTVSPHFMGIAEMLSLGRELGIPVPARVRIFAVEVQDPFTVGTSLTPCLRELLPEITRQILAAIDGGDEACVIPAATANTMRIAPPAVS